MKLVVTKACWRAGTLGLGLIAVLFPLGHLAFAQSVSLSRTSLQFGTYAVGKTSSTLNVILTNSDPSVSLAINAVVASGEYTESDDCNGLVAPLGSCTLLVTFKPNTGGAVTGVVTINDNANNSPQLITTTGTGVIPLTLSPTKLTFSTVAVGSSSSTKAVTVTNNMSKSLNIAFAVSGDYTAAGSGATPCGTTLAAKKSCTTSVTFKPTVNGVIDGSLTVTQNIDKAPQIVALSGTGSGGTTPNLSFSPSSLSFPDTALGTAAAKTVTVTNNSSKAITISAFSASGDYSASGGATSPCSGSLAAGDQCTISVSFSPTAVATITGGLTISNSGSVKTIVLSLSGKGELPVKVSPTSLTFASQNQGAVSAPQIVTLTNHLKTTLNISGIAVSGDYSTVLVPPLGCGNLAPSASCQIGVTFSPIARKGAIPGTLTITSNASSSPNVVQLSGNATGSLPRFAYAINNADNTVSMYTVDVRTGRLRSNGYVLAGTGPSSIAVDPDNKFTYVANYRDGTISAYKIDSKKGTLSEITGSPFTTGSTPPSVTVAPSGKFAYVTSIVDNTISGYAINSTTGALTAVSGSPFITGNYPEEGKVHPSGKFAYVVNTLDNTVSGYKIDSGSGALTTISGSPFPTGGGPVKMAIDPAGKFAYVTNETDGTVSAYSINTSSGALTQIAGSPYPTGGVDPFAATVDHLGKFLFVADVNSNQISVYGIDAGSGALAAVPGSPFPTEEYPSDVIVDASNQFLYVPDQGANDVETYSINPASGALMPLETVAGRFAPFAVAMTSGSNPVTYVPRFAYVADVGDADVVSGFTIDPLMGGLTAVPGSPFPAGSIALGAAVDPWERFAYVTNQGDNDVSAYTIDPSTGSLTAISGSPFASGKQPAAVTVDPSGRFAYTANAGDSSVSAYTIDATGALHAISNYYIGPNSEPLAVTVDPSGRFAYVVNVENSIFVFAINPSTGALSSAGSTTTGLSSPMTLAVDPSGRFAYVANYSPDAGSVSVFAINSSTGALTSVSGTTSGGLSGATWVAVDPSGRFAYVANQNNSAVSAYTIDPSSGALTPIKGSPFASGSLSSLAAVDPSGKFVYVDSRGSAGVSVYTIDASSGALTQISGSPFPAGSSYSLAIAGKIY